VKRLVACLAVVLLATAGCTALPGVGGDVSPPGVEDGELANETALLEAHVDERGDSYEVTNVYEETAGDAATTDEERLVVADGAIYVERESATNGSTTSTYEAFANESFAASRLDRGDGPDFGLGTRHSPGSTHGAARQYDLLRLADFRTAGTTTHDGERVARLRADSFVENASVDADLEDATLLVDGDGLVHELEYSLTDYAGTDEFHHTVRLSATDVDAAPTPEWTSDARAELPTADLDVRTTSDGFVAIDHVGGDTFTARIRVDDQLFTEENFGEGQTLFVGADGDTYELGPTQGGDPVEGSVEVAVEGIVNRKHVTVNATD
jgi:predicted small secreted protein